MNSLRSALTALRAGKTLVHYDGEGANRSAMLTEASLVTIGRKNGGRSLPTGLNGEVDFAFGRVDSSHEKLRV